MTRSMDLYVDIHVKVHLSDREAIESGGVQLLDIQGVCVCLH